MLSANRPRSQHQRNMMIRSTTKAAIAAIQAPVGIKSAVTTAAVVVLLWASSAMAYTGAREFRRTRTFRSFYTQSYSSSAFPKRERAAAATSGPNDPAASEDPRWVFPWPKEERLMQQSPTISSSTSISSKQNVVPSKDEVAVDDYLEFLDRRYK